MSILSKAIQLQKQYNPCQNSNGIFYKNRKKILKFVWDYKRSQTASQSNLGKKKKKKNKQRTQPDFETYKDTIVKEICFW